MATIQSTYTEDHSEAYAGMIANTSTCDVDSYVYTGDASIAFGRAMRSTTAVQGTPGCSGYTDYTSDADASDFIGVNVIDRTLQPSQDDQYSKGDVVSVMWRGDVWVSVASAVTAGGRVSFVVGTGQFGGAAKSATTGAEIAEITNGYRWLTAQSTVGGLALLRIAADSPAQTTT